MPGETVDPQAVQDPRAAAQAFVERFGATYLQFHRRERERISGGQQPGHQASVATHRSAPPPR